MFFHAVGNRFKFNMYADTHTVCVCAIEFIFEAILS